MTKRKRTVIAEGKTKKIIADGDPRKVIIQSKDDLTAGDGEFHVKLSDKAEFANRTACNVFLLLSQQGVPVAFDGQVTETSFRAPRCAMLPYEVVVRQEAHGSILERRHDLGQGDKVSSFEIFLKTDDHGRWVNGYQFSTPDPLLHQWADGNFAVCHPKQPLAPSTPERILTPEQVFEPIMEAANIDWEAALPRMNRIAFDAFMLLQGAWARLDKRLVDFKVEFGVSPDGRLLLADVIDNDSWRLMDGDEYLDKQFYRDGGDLNAVREKYRYVQKLTEHFWNPAYVENGAAASA